jgi:hypothetical protein
MTFPIKIFSKEYSKDDVIEVLKYIVNRGVVKYKGDGEFIRDMIPNLINDRSLTKGQYIYLKDILFKYDGNLMKELLESGRIIKLEVSNVDIKWAKEQIEKFESTGAYRYRGVDAYKGVAAEKVIKDWLSEKYSIESNRPLGDGDDIDDFDFKIGDITCDIKSTTQWYHASITPKVKVENKKPKDYYIGARFDDRYQNRYCVYVIGYLHHSDIIKYPIKQKYGTPYYEVKLVDMKDFNELLKIFNFYLR